ncbi:putative uncharacterized protein ENSP00000383309 [Triticum aestivum]|uniref:putative uncharacterized protein ENSP00000383309 n=1 Tax=Triticum aestivum TaxID=4565 RepID=UPI001D010BA4|nr:putative uncharacterized protein ENSP00000383309 [Triticum aestivum]
MRFQEEGLPLTMRQMVLAVLTGAPLPDDMPKKSCLLYRCENKAEFAAGTPSFDVWGLRPIGLVGPRENPVDVVPFLAAGAELAPSEGAGGQAPTEVGGPSAEEHMPRGDLGASSSGAHDPSPGASVTEATQHAVPEVKAPEAWEVVARRRPTVHRSRAPLKLSLQALLWLRLALAAMSSTSRKKNNPTPHDPLTYAPLTVTTAAASFPHVGGLSPPRAALLLPRRQPPPSTTRRPPPSLAPDASLHHAPPSSSPAPAACLHYAPPSSFPGAGRLPPPPAALLLPRRRPPASTTRRPPPRHAAAALLPPPACRRRPAPFPSATLPPCSLPQRAPATVAARSTAATLVRSPLPTKAVRRRSTTQRSALADHSHPPQAVERHLRRRFIAAATWILLVPTSDVYSSMSSFSSCSVARLLHLVQVRDGGC